MKKEIKQTCFLCGKQYHYGHGRYNGRVVPGYGFSVCSNCWDYNWDGWNPQDEEKILKHLEGKGIQAPERNENGWLPREFGG